MSVRKNGYIVVTFKFRKEGNIWAAFCEELGTATFGRSIPEAHKKLKEAVILHLSTLEDVGERERFLKNKMLHFILTSPKRVILKYPGPWMQTLL